MEEQLTALLNNTLQNSHTYQAEDNIFNIYYEMFKRNKYMGSNFENIYNDMQENYNIELQSIRYGHNNTHERKTFQDLVLAVISEIDSKKKIELIPLIIYLDNNRLLYNHLHQINYFTDFIESIKNFFVGTVMGSEIKVENIEQLPFYHQEKEWHENYKNGIKNINFQQIYSFIDGFERGRGFDFDTYIDFFVFITYKYFFIELVDITNKKKDMFEIIYLINILNIEETLNLAHQSENTLLKFEAIRKAVYFKNNNQLSLNLLKDERKLLQEIVIQLANDKKIWQQFLDYYLKYPLRSVQLFKPLGEVISQLDNSSRDMLIQSVEIDRFFSVDSKEALNSCFLNIEENEIQKYCLGTLFQRWLDFIDTSSYYFGSIVLTDIIDLVIAYITNFLDEKIITQEIEQILYNLEEIDNKWFIDSLEQSNYFYKQMTILFVYGFTLEKHKLHDLKEKISIICSENHILKNEKTHQAKSTLQLFKEYIA